MPDLALPAGADALARELDVLRPALLRIARLHLRNDAWAEDAVAETVLAAMERKTTFDGRSQLKTWVVGILKHKVVDAFRARRRDAPLVEPDDDGVEDAVFAADGHYRDWPTEWSTPESLLARDQFLAILETCVQQLPPAQGRIFLMREWLELSTDAICDELAITPNHAGVLLHRARLRLRECLRIRWFESSAR